MNSDDPTFPDPSDEDGIATKTGTPPKLPEPGTPQDIAAALASELKAGTYDEHSEQELGKGGMGRVLRATQRGLRREVALKRLLKNAEAVKQRFVWEARITGLLEHPSIVPVHEINVDVQGEVYYTMKLVQGSTVLDILNSLRPEVPQKEGESPEAFAARKANRERLKKQHGNLAALLNIFQKVCDAISFAHAHPLRVIHRDLKPENIMVGDYGEVLVMDWGLAKVLNWKKAPAHLLVKPELHEEAGESVSDAPQHSLPASQRGAYGTPGYAPPEMCDPELGEADERSDIYSLGAILHEILTLFPVSEGTTIAQRLEQTRTGQVALRLKHDQGKSLNVPHCPGAHVPQDLVPVVLKALRPHATERMQSVAEIKQALADYQNGFANAFQNAGAWTHFKYFVKRHTAAVVTVAVALVTVAGVSGVFSWNLSVQKILAQNERDEKEKQLVITAETRAEARHQQASEQLRLGDEFEALPFALAAHELRPGDEGFSALLFSIISHKVPALPIYAPIRLASEPVTCKTNADGSRLLTTGMGLPLQVFDVKTGRELANVPVRSTEFLAAGFTEDSAGVFAYSDKDLKLRIWDGLPNGPLIQEIATGFSGDFVLTKANNGLLAGHLNSMVSQSLEMVGMSGESPFPVAMGSPEHFANMSADFSFDSSVLRGEFFDVEVERLVVSSDEKYVATGDANGRIVVFESVSGKQVLDMAGECKIRTLQFHPNGRRLLVGTTKGAFRIYRVPEGTVDFTWNFSSGDGLADASFEHGGKFLAASSSDSQGWLQLWDGENGQRVFYTQLYGAADEIRVGKGGASIFAAGDEVGLSLVDVPSRTVNRLPINQRAEADHFGWDEDSGVAWLLDRTQAIRAFRTDASPLGSLDLPQSGDPEVIEFSPDGHHALVVSTDGTMCQLWDVSKGLPAAPAVRHASPIVSANFSGDGLEAILLRQDGSSEKWGASNGTVLAKNPAPVAYGFCMGVVSKNGKSMVQAPMDLAPFIAALEAGGAGIGLKPDVLANLRKKISSRIVTTEVGDFSQKTEFSVQGMVFGLGCSEDARVIAAVHAEPGGGGAGEMLFSVWRDGKKAGELAMALTKAPVAVSAAGDLAALNDKRGSILLGLEPVRVIARLPHQREVNVTVFSHSGKLVATASDDGTARLWHTVNGAPASEPLVHSDKVLDVAFSPDDKWLVSGGADTAAIVWEVATGRQVSIPLGADDWIHCVRFSPDGKWVATCSDDGNVRLWEWLGLQGSAPPSWVSDFVRLASGSPGNDTEPWPMDALVSKTQQLPDGPWKGAFLGALQNSSTRRVTPMSTFTVAENHVRLANCYQWQGNMESAVHQMRFALAADASISVPNELENLRRLVKGEPVIEASATSPVGADTPGAGKAPGEALTNGQNINLHWCPAGKFTMGDPPGTVGRWSNETSREVYLTHGFWMGETEITQEQWKTVMGDSPVDLVSMAMADKAEYALDGVEKPLKTLKAWHRWDDETEPKNYVAVMNGDYPIYFISQKQAADFCAKLNELEKANGTLPLGWAYRLPTEAEWEYACRSSKPGILYEGTLLDGFSKHNEPAVDALAWYAGNSHHNYSGPGWPTGDVSGSPYQGATRGPRAVRGKKPNAWGLYDMLGNLHEWTSSRVQWDMHMKCVDPQTDTGEIAVYRGGAWNCYAVGCRNASRSEMHEAGRTNAVGFRVCLAPTGY